jgi:hypothetical protein
VRIPVRPFVHLLALATFAADIKCEDKKYDTHPTDGVLIEFVVTKNKVPRALMTFEIRFEGKTEGDCFTFDDRVAMNPYCPEASFLKRLLQGNSIECAQIAENKIVIVGYRNKENNKLYVIKSVKFTLKETTPDEVMPKVTEFRPKS